jgi:hypothetical protein
MTAFDATSGQGAIDFLLVKSLSFTAAKPDLLLLILGFHCFTDS